MINLHTFLEKRRELEATARRDRGLCMTCLQSQAGCFCAAIRRFDPRLHFVILMHPIERKRRIATGRMSHLCLENSRLIMEEDYSLNGEVNGILADERLQAVVLYPGPASLNLSEVSEIDRGAHFAVDRELVVFVIDGTWATARKMIRSTNLHGLPRICFNPPRLSRFRVRKQPAPECYSTIEAIHQTIELLGPCRGFDLTTRTHDALLDVFDVMVERQLRFTPSRRSKLT